jgi:hypothetical protein
VRLTLVLAARVRVAIDPTLAAALPLAAEDERKVMHASLLTAKD